MEHATQTNEEQEFYLDLPFFFRTVRRWLLAILSVSIIVGVSAYLVADLFVPDSYSASVVCAVIPKNNTYSAVADNSYDTALERCINMWNSNALMKTIRDQNPDQSVGGSIKAASIKGTSLIRVTASGTSVQEAYFLLHEAMDDYMAIKDNFITDYHCNVVDRLTTDSIAVGGLSHSKIALAGFGASFLGLFGLLFVWTMMTDVLHNESQAKKLLDLHIYEVLKQIKKSRGQKALLLSQQNLPLDYMESIDKLTSRVRHYLSRHRRNIMLVTSIYEDEGKTTVAANIALNLARRGNKVLLIDLDFRKPAVAKILDHFDKSKGDLTDAILDKEPIESLIQTREDLYGLSLISQFRSRKNPEVLLENSDLKQQIRGLSTKYDYIILDTPPMGPVRDTDVIAEFAECSLLVLRQDYSRAAIANDVGDSLEKNGSPVMGVVLNRYQQKSSHSGKGYGYQKYDHYHYYHRYQSASQK